ncbi:hypothetical protein RvY_13318 [Ramazzottius varieornatus]|uniref:XRN2-binding (XTBD) domain-containing protein n=1 Tax=Ramazzottius varieornatus TaxID=947166 RepID=A0A1D1VPM3_RAMVA|nr:hypothetical protein RvY_13318 [Ramazzottius varieornatus]
MAEVGNASGKPSTTSQLSSTFPFQKASHETKVQWEYRKRFLEYYNGQYPDDQLECWSKIISNAKFYGCK